MSGNGLIEGIEGDKDFGPEDDLDAFNDDTFGGAGLGDEWKEDAHEELAMLTEQERMALKQSQDFFNFASDGEELGGELEDALEPGPGQTSGESHSDMVQRMDELSVGGGGHTLPPAPLTVQTSGAQMGLMGQPMPPHNFPQHQQQVIYHHQLPPQPMPPQLMPQQPGQPQQFPLLPPSHFAPGPGPAPGQFQDPAIMSLSKLPPQPTQFMPQVAQQPQYMPQQPPQFQQQGQARPAFSPPTVPGMKTLADIEAEMMFGGPRPPVHNQQPQAMAMERGGHVGHVNPAMHNLNYPGMRDRQTQQHQMHHQQQQQQQTPQQLHQQQQFRNSPGLTNQQQLQQGLQHHLKHNQHNNQNNRNQQNQQQQHQRFNNNNFNDGGNRRRNDYHQYENRRDQYYDRDHQEGHQRQRRGYNDINRRNEETFGAAAVKEQEVKGKKISYFTLDYSELAQNKIRKI